MLYYAEVLETAKVHGHFRVDWYLFGRCAVRADGRTVSKHSAQASAIAAAERLADARSLLDDRDDWRVQPQELGR